MADRIQQPSTMRPGRYRLETIDPGSSATYSGANAIVTRVTIMGRGTTNIDVPDEPTIKINTPDLGPWVIEPRGQFDYDGPFQVSNGTGEQIIVELLSIVP